MDELSGYSNFSAGDFRFISIADCCRRVEVNVGSQPRTFQVVRETSADDDENLIAYDTSLGRNLLGRRINDQFSHTLFDGSQVMIRVLAIR